MRTTHYTVSVYCLTDFAHNTFLTADKTNGRRHNLDYFQKRYHETFVLLRCRTIDSSNPQTSDFY